MASFPLTPKKKDRIERNSKEFPISTCAMKCWRGPSPPHTPYGIIPQDIGDCKHRFSKWHTLESASSLMAIQTRSFRMPQNWSSEGTHRDQLSDQPPGTSLLADSATAAMSSAGPRVASQKKNMASYPEGPVGRKRLFSIIFGFFFQQTSKIKKKSLIFLTQNNLEKIGYLT